MTFECSAELLGLMEGSELTRSLVDSFDDLKIFSFLCSTYFSKKNLRWKIFPFKMTCLLSIFFSDNNIIHSLTNTHMHTPSISEMFNIEIPHGRTLVVVGGRDYPELTFSANLFCI